jgi:integrase/recombinase XerD
MHFYSGPPMHVPSGVDTVNRGIALNMVQKWLGHAQLTTTAIYANAVGEEEQSIAARMW